MIGKKDIAENMHWVLVKNKNSVLIEMRCNKLIKGGRR